MEKKGRGIGKHTKQFVRNQCTQVKGNKTIRKKRPVMQEKRYRYKTQHKVGKTLEKNTICKKFTKLNDNLILEAQIGRETH